MDINPDLLDRLRELASEQGISFKDALNQAITRGLGAPRTTTRTPYRMPTFALGLERSLDVARVHQVIADEDTEAFLRKFLPGQGSRP